MSRNVRFVKHDGYRLHPLKMWALRVKWLRSALTFSHSLVFHRGHDATRHVQMQAFRYGVALTLSNRLMLAVYAETKQKVIGESCSWR